MCAKNFGKNELKMEIPDVVNICLDVIYMYRESFCILSPGPFMQEYGVHDMHLV